MNKADITYQDKLNELRLDISHPNSSGINFVFVEGDTDIRLFRKLGFNEEGVLRKHYFVDGEYKDVLIMSLFRIDFDTKG